MEGGNLTRLLAKDDLACRPIRCGRGCRRGQIRHGLRLRLTEPLLDPLDVCAVERGARRLRRVLFGAAASIDDGHVGLSDP